MKKSFLTLASLVMVLGLVGCTGQGASQEQKSGSQEGSGSQGSEVVPVVEGKVTVYLTAHFSGVELPNYAAINLAGGFTSWNQGHPEETQLTKLEGTDIFYIQVAAPAAGDVTYKVILGYTEASGLSGADLGVNWGNEAKGYPVDQFGPGEGGNKTLAFAGTETTVNLGEYTWETMLDEPSPDYYDIDLYVDFFEDVPAGYHVYVMGAFNGWASAIELEKDAEAEGVRYHFEMEDVLAKEYEFKALVHPTAKDAEGFNPWSDDRWEVVPGDNSKFTVNALCEEGPRNLFGGTKKYHVANQMDAVMTAAKGDAVEFVGVVCAMHKDANKNGIWVADRTNCIEVFPKTDNVEGIAIGDTVAVNGKIDTYTPKGKTSVTREVIVNGENTLIEKLEVSHNQTVQFTRIDRELLGKLDVTKDLNLPVEVVGKVTKVDEYEKDGALNSVTITVEIAAAEGELEAATIDVYTQPYKDAAVTEAMQALKVGDQVTFRGVLGAYNDVQVIAPILVA